MPVYSISATAALRGEVAVNTSKNAVLPIMAASILAPGASTVIRCPRIADVESMRGILQCLGCASAWTRRMKTTSSR